MSIPSPLAPESLPNLPPVRGVRLAAGAAGIRYRGRDDVLLVELAPETTVAGRFTRSAAAASPVLWCRQALASGRARALIVNAGNANAFTGNAGVRAVERTVLAAVDAFGCPSHHVYTASTGVIGEPFPVEKLLTALPRLVDHLSSDAWEAASAAIMTTDTFPKRATRTTEIDRVPVTINGIAKGSGMIAPDLATMLAFIFTDATIKEHVLQTILDDIVERTFNAITVDGDTSTNDSVLLFATGGAGHAPITRVDDPRLARYCRAVEDVARSLAQLIVRDGEGASKFVTIKISGAEHDRAAATLARSVAQSPLVKTAIAGADANWGRLVMAVGKAGEQIDIHSLSIRIGGVLVTDAGSVVPGYDEGPVAEHMRGREISISIDVGVGRGTATMWTCDLTHGYIDINAAYRS